MKLLTFDNAQDRDQVLNANAGHASGVGTFWLILGYYYKGLPKYVQDKVTADVTKAAHKAGGVVTS